MSRSLRFETRSRARDELRRAMTSIDKVKKWEKKWVSVGGNSCKLKVFKWVPREPTEQENKAEKPIINGQVVPEEKVVPKETPKFPAPFLQPGNEDSRDSYTNSSDKLEFMKYCADPDTQDSITESETTVTMSDQLDDSTKPNSKCSTPPASDPKITVSNYAFKDQLEEPALPPTEETAPATLQPALPPTEHTATLEPEEPAVVELLPVAELQPESLPPLSAEQEKLPQEKEKREPEKESSEEEPPLKKLKDDPEPSIDP